MTDNKPSDDDERGARYSDEERATLAETHAFIDSLPPMPEEPASASGPDRFIGPIGMDDQGNLNVVHPTDDEQDDESTDPGEGPN